MRGRHLRSALLVVAMAALAGGTRLVQGQGGYDTAALEKARASREAALKTDTGWLTVAGLHFLKQGENSVGRAPTNDIVLDFPGVPDQGAIVILQGDQTRIRPPSGKAVTVNGATVSQEAPLARGGQNTVSFGRVNFFVHYSGPRLALRVRHLDSPLRTGFKGLRYFPANPAYRVKAVYTPYPSPEVVNSPNILGDLEPFTIVGTVAFELGGAKHNMVAWRSGQRLWFVFRDLTSGKETYQASRFLYQPLPAAGEFFLDFNYAENPPCGLNPYTTCPVPPAQNRLNVRVEAGEMTYDGRTQ